MLTRALVVVSRSGTKRPKKSISTIFTKPLQIRCPFLLCVVSVPSIEELSTVSYNVFGIRFMVLSRKRKIFSLRRRGIHLPFLPNGERQFRRRKTRERRQWKVFWSSLNGVENERENVVFSLFHRRRLLCRQLRKRLNVTTIDGTESRERMRRRRYIFLGDTPQLQVNAVEAQMDQLDHRIE